MKLRFSHKYDRHFYGCVRFPDCLGAHGAHPDGKSLGIPASKETRSARIRAHAAFDKLWQGVDARMNRSQAYAWMKEATGFQHIGELTTEECERLCSALLVAFDIDGGT
jgi:hypothetical protein